MGPVSEGLVGGWGSKQVGENTQFLSLIGEADAPREIRRPLNCSIPLLWRSSGIVFIYVFSFYVEAVGNLGEISEKGKGKDL
jgi:hypothetical protein